MNAKIDWVKISTEIFSDDKIKLIRSRDNGDQLALIWIMLIIQAAKTNAGGSIYLSENMPYNAKSLSVIFTVKEDTISKALETFSALQMIEIDSSGRIYLPNFASYQNVDKLDKIKNDNKIRQQRFRERQKSIPPSSEITLNNVTHNVTVTQNNATEYKNIRNKNKKEETEDIYRGKTRFSAPSMDEIVSFFISEKSLNKSDAEFYAERFIQFYDSKGWMVGKNKMTNWKTAATRSLDWEDKRKSQTKAKFGFNEINEEEVLKNVR